MLHETISWMEKKYTSYGSYQWKSGWNSPLSKEQQQPQTASNRKEVLVACFLPCFLSASSYLMSYLGLSCWFSWLALSHHTEDFVLCPSTDLNEPCIMLLWMEATSSSGAVLEHLELWMELSYFPQISSCTKFLCKMHSWTSHSFYQKGPMVAKNPQTNGLNSILANKLLKNLTWNKAKWHSVEFS